MLLLTPVACPLPGRAEGAPKLSGHDRVVIHEGTRLRAILGVETIEEEYFCNYEPNPAYREIFERGDFRICAESARTSCPVHTNRRALVCLRFNGIYFTVTFSA